MDNSQTNNSQTTNPSRNSNNTIDCIFDIKGTHVVLIKRAKWPFAGYWALPGGRQHMDEEIEQTAVREMSEETGIDIKLFSEQPPFYASVLGEETFLEQIRTYNSGKDPRGGNCTVFAVRLDMDPKDVEKYIRSGSDAVSIMVCGIKDLPDLAFDHFRFLEDYYVRLRPGYRNPIPAVDVILEYNGKYVYVDRANFPKGKSLPGGFAKFGKSFEQSILEEIKEETNLEAEITGILGVYSDPKRDPRRHITTTTFMAKGSGTLRFGDDACGGGLFTMDHVPEFVFDHNRIVEDYKRYVKGIGRPGPVTWI